MNSTALAIPGRKPTRTSGLLAALPDATRVPINLLMLSTLPPVVIALLELFTATGAAQSLKRLTVGSVGVAVVLLAWALPLVLKAILDEQRVINARLLPSSAVALDRRAGERLMVAAWMILAVPVAVYALLKPDISQQANLPGLLSALAWSSVILALLCITVAAWRGALPAVVLPLALLALGALLGQGIGEPVAWLATHGLLAAAAAVASLAALWWVLQCVFRPRPPATPGRAGSPREAVLAAARQLHSRFRPVTRSSGLFPIFLAPMLFHPHGALLFETWNSPVDAASLCKLIVWAGVMGGSLVTNSLHWRTLLVPGGRARQCIGPDIVLRSWALAVGVIGVWFALTSLTSPNYSAHELLRMLPQVLLLRAPTMLSELLLVTALATWLRPGLANANGLIVAVSCAMLAIGLLGSSNVLPGQNWPLGWSRGLAHHIGVLLLAGLFTLLAQRRWARTDLRPWQLKPG